MTSRDFAYWLQGFFEISEASEFGEKTASYPEVRLNC
jgi:hypothetical protein